MLSVDEECPEAPRAPSEAAGDPCLCISGFEARRPVRGWMIRRLLAGLLLSAVAVPAAAQEPAADTLQAEQSFCFQARPAVSCRAFIIAQMSLFPAVASSEVRGTRGGIQFSTRELDEHYDWELGVMANTNDRSAWGGSAGLGVAGDFTRLSLKARHRRWLSRLAAVDAAVGLVRSGRRVPDRNLGCSDIVPGYGLTGDIAIGFVDWASLAARGDIIWAEGGEGAATGAYAGITLGPAPSAGVTTGLAVLFLFLIATSPEF